MSLNAVFTVWHLAEEIERGLRRAHPKLRKTVIRKLAATAAVALQTQTANTAAWAAVLPRDTERADMRLQGIARLLANDLVESSAPGSWSRSRGSACVSRRRTARPSC